MALYMFHIFHVGIQYELSSTSCNSGKINMANVNSTAE